jgi:NAD(P)-dependent dehydrogenase (short-subunit alcohol dehydrogenase family)
MIPAAYSASGTAQAAAPVMIEQGRGGASVLTGPTLAWSAAGATADVSNAIAWLVSDEARHVTAVALPVDAGFTAK